MSINAFLRRSVRKADADADAALSATESGEGLLDSLKKHGGDLMGRVAVSVKEAAGSHLLRQASAARRRGNLAAAFHLAKEEYAGHPDEPEIANFYWEVAVEYERPAEAVEAVVGLIKKNVIGAHEVSTGYWVELSDQVPDALIDPSILARMIPHLAHQIEEAGEVEGPEVSEEDSEREKEDPVVTLARSMRASRELALRAAIRGVVDERNRDALTGGVAMHLAELARELDPTSALVAARFALECQDVHRNKRDQLRVLIAELDPNDPGTNPARNHPLYENGSVKAHLSGDEVTALKKRLVSSSTIERTSNSADTQATASAPTTSQPLRVERDPEPVAARLSSIPIDLAVEALVFVDLKCVLAKPTGLDDTMLFVEHEGGRRSGIKVEKVQAIAVVEVDGLAEGPVVLIDLLMNVRSDDETPVRIVRLRGDEFDPLTLMPDESDSSTAFQAFLARLMEYTHAIALPDPKAALGLVVPHFDSLEAYEQQVLQVRR